MKWSIPERVVERGREYMKEGRVLSVEQDLDRKLWHAEVLGKELYHVTLDGTAKENDRCECPYWIEHGYCKHTVAVELYLKQRGISRIMTTAQPSLIEKRTTSVSEMFTKGFAKLNEEMQESQLLHPLVIDYVIDVIETNNYYPELAVLGISLRIGSRGTQTKTYVIKNIGEFFQTLSKEGSYIINKKHQFLLTKEAFTVETAEILTTLAGIFQTNQLMGVKGIQVKGKIDKRYLILPIDQRRELLDKMIHTPHFVMNDGEHKYRKLTFSTDSLPLFLRLVRRNQPTNYKLMIN